MYDTIKFGVFVENPALVISLLEKQITISDPKTGEIVRSKGLLKNMRCTFTGHHLIVEGSLAKFYYGNNLEVLTPETARLAIDNLVDILQIKAEHANLFRLDIGSNIYLDDQIPNYLDSLGILKKYFRKEEKNGLYYVMGSRTLCFYDKGKELIKNKNQDQFINLEKKNILRYEFRTMKRLKREYHVASITLADTRNIEFFRLFLLRWFNEYRNIQKLSKLSSLDVFFSKDIRVFKNHLAAIAMKKIYGFDNLVELYKKKQMSKEINRFQYARIYNALEELNEIDYWDASNYFIEELDEKILLEVEKYL